MSKNIKGAAFFEAGSWYHRTKKLNADGSTSYSKKGGFSSAAEAEISYAKCEEEYRLAYRNLKASPALDMNLSDYLEYWLDNIFRQRVENSTYSLSRYVLDILIMPEIQYSIKLKNVTSSYLDSLLEKVSVKSASAGNKSREFLNMAFKDAVEHEYIHRNPVIATKPYRRKKPNVVVVDKAGIRALLSQAADSSWYLEILFALFMGLRKGEINGLKFSDYDEVTGIISISRQITTNPLISEDGKSVKAYKVSEKDPKTENSFRTLKVPKVVMVELGKRKEKIEIDKGRLGSQYNNRNYISCRDNGLPHSASAMNTALTKICQRAGLPHLTVHGLRHMYATILLEQGIPLVKVSALLGHSSVHTTFEYYCEVMDEQGRIIGFMNDSFAV